MYKRTALAVTAAILLAPFFGPAPATANTGTDINGDVIRTNTTWTAAGSPYRIRAAVQVAEGATLTLEPGVSVTGAGGTSLFLLAGGLSVNGTADRPVMLDGGQAGAIVGIVSRDVERLPISIRHAQLRDAGEFISTSGYAVSLELTLSDSVLQDLPGDTYLWYPKGDSRIERNVFIRTGGFSVGLRSPSTVLFQHNRFQTASSSGVWVESWNGTGSAAAQVHANAFMVPGSVSVGLARGYTSAGLDATGNYWGTTDLAVIRTMVADGNSSIDRVGTIPVDPILSAIPAQVPAVPITTPSAPGQPSAIPGDGEVSLTWTPPASDGGAPITGYRVTSMPASAGCNTTAVTCVVTGLTNGTTYTFQVVASNQAGSSEGSPTSTPVTPAGAPSPPGAPVAVIGDGEVSLTWTAPVSDGGTPITGYTVTSTPASAGCSTATLTCRVRGLTNGTAYRFRVVATNAAGSSDSSAESEPATPAGAPAAPQDLRTRGTTVTFTVSTTSGSGLVRNEYRVRTVRSWSPWKSIGLRQRVVVSPCTSGKTVRVQIRSVNAIGPGPAAQTQVRCTRPR